MLRVLSGNIIRSHLHTQHLFTHGLAPQRKSSGDGEVVAPVCLVGDALPTLRTPIIIATQQLVGILRVPNEIDPFLAFAVKRGERICKQALVSGLRYSGSATLYAQQAHSMHTTRVCA